MRVLYIGGFEMPDKNAAAQRVLAVAKIFKELGDEIQFYGITKTGDNKGEVDGLTYEAIGYPKKTSSWVQYALGNGIIGYINSVHPDCVILYNYPAIAQEKIIRYCRKNGIKAIGDITEWYRKRSVIKDFDTWLRMKYVNRHLDGMIVISKYLNDFYVGCNTIQLPPLVDKSESKWQLSAIPHDDSRIHLVYIGTGSIKDRLDKVLLGIENVNPDRFVIDILGIDKDQYSRIYSNSTVNLERLSVSFHGRVPHKEAIVYLKSSDFQIFFRDNIRVNNAGFPTKFVESMSAGIPVITNRISNISDYIVNGENSFLIEDNSDDNILSVIKTVSDLSRPEIDKIKSNCLVSEFDYHNYIGNVRLFFDSL